MGALLSSAYDAFKRNNLIYFCSQIAQQKRSAGYLAWTAWTAGHPRQGSTHVPDHNSRCLASFGDFVAVARSYPQVHLFVGFGSKAQFADVDEVIGGLRPILRDIEQHCCGQRWLAICGGDKANPAEPDLGLLMLRLQEEYGCDLLAVQSGGEPETHTTFNFSSEPQHRYDESSDKMEIVYGGVLNGELVGCSRFYLADELAKPDPSTGRRLLDSIIVAGGGQVALEELQYADQVGLTWTYLPCRARVEEFYGTYGPVHDWVKDRLAVDHRRPVTVTSRCPEERKKDKFRRW